MKVQAKKYLIPFEEILGQNQLLHGKYFIVGEPGTGKTTVALQFLYSLLQSSNKRIFFISFKKKDPRFHYFTDLQANSKEPLSRRNICFDNIDYGTEIPVDTLLQRMKKNKSQMVILDDIHIPGQFWSKKDMQKFLRFIASFSGNILMTSLPINLCGSSSELILKISDMCDGLIELRYIPIDNQMRLWYWIPKHNGNSSISEGQFCKITDRGLYPVKEIIASHITSTGVSSFSSKIIPKWVMPEILYFSAQQEKKIRKRVENYNQQHSTFPVRLPEKQISSILEYNQLIQQFEEGKSPFCCLPIDLFRLPEFVERELLYPLDDFFPESMQKDYLDLAIQQCRYRGRIYAIPHYINIGVLAYRKDLLEKYHQNPPANWDQLIESTNIILQDQKNRALQGIGIQGAQFEILTCNFLEWLWCNGGDIYDSAGHIIINRPEAVDMLRLIQNLIFTNGLSPQNTHSMMESQCERMFLQGELIFMRSWPRIISQAELPHSYVANRVGIVPLPVGPAGKESIPIIGATGYAIPRSVPDPEPVWKYLSTLIDEESSIDFATHGWSCPPQISIYENPDVIRIRPYYQEMKKLIPTGRLRQNIPHYAVLTALTKREIHLVLRNEKDPQHALESIAKELHKSIHRQMHMVPVHHAMEYIHIHLKDRLSRDIVAKSIGISSSHFSVVFKDVTGQSFTDYVLQARIEEAKRLLGKPELNISQISNEVGFSEESYFCYTFRRMTGVTPSHYRLNLQGTIKSL